MEKTFAIGSIPMEHAGQFIFPADLACARAKFAEARINAAQLREIEDECIRKVVMQQRQAGLSAITDGEFRRTSWDLDFLTGLTGVTKKVVKSGHIWQDVELGAIVPEITGEIAYNPSHPLLCDFVFLKSLLTADETARITLPAPAHLLLWVVVNTDIKAYQAMSMLSKAFVDTILHLYNLGCRSVIFRDTSWSTFCDRDRLKRLIQGGIDPIALMPLLRTVNELVLNVLPDDLERILFVKTQCVDKPAQANSVYDDAVKEILRHKGVTAFMTDYSTIAAFIEKHSHEFPTDKGLILGVVSAAQPQLETHDEIAAKISFVLKSISPAWIKISPTDGFMLCRNAIDTSAFTEVDQWRKLQLLAGF